MKLYAVDVIGPVMQCHNQSLVTLCRYLKAVGHAFPFYNPTVVSSHRKLSWQTGEQWCVGNLCHLCRNTVEHIGQIQQSGTEYLSNGLMSQANS